VPPGSAIHFYASDTGAATLQNNANVHGYDVRFQFGGGTNVWTVVKFDSGSNGNGIHSLNWIKAASSQFTKALSQNDVVKIQVRKDASNTIALLVNQVVVDSIQDNSHTDLFYAAVRSPNGEQTQLDDFSIGPYSFAPPPPPGPDTTKPVVISAYTTPATGNIDTNSTVVVSVQWSDNSWLKADSLWIVGYAGLTDTVLVAHTENINTAGHTISSPGKKYKVGTHYFFSSAKDTAASQNYFKTVQTYSFRVDTSTTSSQSNLVAIGYMQYWSPNFPDPHVYGAIDWTVWTHLIHHQGDPSQTQIVDPAVSYVHYWSPGGGTFSTYEGGVGPNGGTFQRALIDSAHVHGRKVLMGLGGTAGAGINFDWISANNHMKDFVSGISRYCKTRGYDGIDLDWEQPGPGSAFGVTEKSAAYDLLRTLHDTLSTWTTPGIITWAAQPWTFNWVLAPESTLQWVNYLNIMNYDYNDFGSNFCAHHTPLYPYTVAGIPAATTQVNCTSWQDSLYVTNAPENAWGSMSHYPKNRLNVGLGFYGHGRNGNTLGGPGTSAGFERYGNCTLGMYNTPATAYRYHYDPVAQSPYLAWTDASAPGCGFGGTVHFHTFDDTTSIQVKAQWARDHGYAGVMVFDLPGDDAGFNLARAVGKALKGGIAVVPVDSLAPNVTITTVNGVAPFNGQSVSGSINIAISAQDNSSVTSVTVYIDSNPQTPILLSFPYVFNWDASSYTGNHTIQARAIDPSNNIGVSAIYTLNVQPVTMSRIPAIPQLVSPANNATISTTTTTLTVADTSAPLDVVVKYLYQVKVTDSASVNYVINDSSSNVTSKIVNGLVNGSTYYWRVGAENSIGTVYSFYRKFTVSSVTLPTNYGTSSNWDPQNGWWAPPSQPPFYLVMTSRSLNSLKGILKRADSSYVVWSPNGIVDSKDSTFPSASGLINQSNSWTQPQNFNGGLTSPNISGVVTLSATTANLGTVVATTPVHNIEFHINTPPMHFDHRIPLAKGGKHHINNIDGMCEECNKSKGAKDQFEEAKASGRSILEQESHSFNDN